MKHDHATKKQSKALYGQGWGLARIAREAGVDVKTVARWRDGEGWAREISPEEAMDARVSHLISLDDKSQKEWRELGRLVELRNKMIRREKRETQSAEGSTPGRGAKGAKGKAGKNEIGHLVGKAKKYRPKKFLSYQLEHLDDPARLRETIKSRQIGFTDVASWGALETAIDAGRNQIFLSASKNQVGMFRDYLKGYFQEQLGLELEGSKERIALHNNGKLWATFYFLSTNTATAQSYHGDVTIDEACWIPSYSTLRKVAGGMATQKQYRTTIFSTPSTVIHPAWQEFQRLLKEQAKRELNGGANPNISLRTTTIHDAVAAGADFFDVEQLRAEFGDGFSQLFECIPLDDETSKFKLAQLEAICKDPAGWEEAVGVRPVKLGYDPSRTTDNASLGLLVELPGPGEKNKFRVFKRDTVSNKSYRWQANLILGYCEKFNVVEISIDTTGMGWAVYELVVEGVKERGLHAKVKAINYSLESKTQLVETVSHFVQEGLLELPAGDTYMLHCFLAIKQTVTGGGRITYKASRTKETGHADVFFAIAHALSGEKIGRKRGGMIIAGG